VIWFAGVLKTEMLTLRIPSNAPLTGGAAALLVRFRRTDVYRRKSAVHDNRLEE